MFASIQNSQLSTEAQDLSPKPWYKTFFNELYWDFFMRITKQDLQTESSLIRSLCSIKPKNVYVVLRHLDKTVKNK